MADWTNFSEIKRQILGLLADSEVQNKVKTVVTDVDSGGGGTPNFVSSVITAPDASQHATAHGLGQSQTAPADSTNVYVTCASGTGSQYQIVAWL